MCMCVYVNMYMTGTYKVKIWQAHSFLCPQYIFHENDNMHFCYIKFLKYEKMSVNVLTRAKFELSW